VETAKKLITGYIKGGPKGIEEDLRQIYIPEEPVYQKPTYTLPGEEVTPEEVTPGEVTPGEVIPGEVIPGEETTPLEYIMGLSPEQVTKQFDILREEGMKGIEDWYEQAIREMEMRGIAQYSGLKGSHSERDLGALLGKRKQMEQDLTNTLDLQKMQMIEAQQYNKLQALEDIRRWEAGYKQQIQNPWIQAGQQMLSLPWGQTSVHTQTMPGVGVLPGTISGLSTGLGMYNWGKELGWWGNQPATAYGSGMNPGVSPIGTWGSYQSGIPYYPTGYGMA
jgi:hypothetical protein